VQLYFCAESTECFPGIFLDFFLFFSYNSSGAIDYWYDEAFNISPSLTFCLGYSYFVLFSSSFCITFVSDGMNKQILSFLIIMSGPLARTSRSVCTP
jgi:hypothetical protein